MHSGEDVAWIRAAAGGEVRTEIGAPSQGKWLHGWLAGMAGCGKGTQECSEDGAQDTMGS